FLTIQLFNWGYREMYAGDIVATARARNILVLRHNKADALLQHLSFALDWPFSIVSAGYPFRIQPGTLEKAESAVNYHNSSLPVYGGLHSTAFAMFFGEQETGYTFHHMTQDIDRGNILLTDSFPTGELSRVDVDFLKASAAGKRWGEVLDSMRHGEPGAEQVGPRSYWGLESLRVFLTVDAATSDKPRWPDTVDIIRRKIEMFGHVRMQVGGRTALVTSVDGRGTPRRVYYLPRPLWAMVARFA
ncbi:hypothetical protein LCGC14_2118990, partial [marine sediment metagenome]